MLSDRHIVVREERRKVTVRDNGSVRIIEVARQGPPGGLGLSGASLSGFQQVFPSPLSTWTVNHNLGRYPVVTILTTGNLEMEAQIIHTNNNQIVVQFSAPQAGRIVCI